MLGQNNYGKSRIRVVKISRHPDRHDLREILVNVALEGDFLDVHLRGDNAKVLPTDTMKNTVYALAKDHPLNSIEDFALHLSDHFITNNPQVTKVTIEIIENLWTRIVAGGKPHPQAFQSAGTHRHTANVTRTPQAATLFSGLKDLLILKTTDSEFTGYIKDKFTSLPETRDRVFATVLDARWMYVSPKVDYAACRDRVTKALLDTFARHHSLSVQHTLYAMGEAVIASGPEVSEIRLSMPNKHCLPIDLAKFGMSNENEVFVPTDEPHGLIEGTVKRG